MSPAALLRRLPLRSIRSRILIIALLPALLTEFGLVAYFTSHTLASREAMLAARAASAASALAEALPDALANEHPASAYRLVDAWRASNHLTRVRVLGASGELLLQSGSDHPGPLHHEYAAIRSSGPEHGTPLGRVEVGVALDQIAPIKRGILIHAALLMVVAMALTGVLAWRLSTRLAGQLGHVGEVVERLADGNLSVRARVPPAGELGALAAGINHMAEALEHHRGELEARVREATADLAAKMEMAERANYAKSRFFAAASHDLRQPLHALSLFVAALKDRNQQPEMQTLIDNIEASTAAMELLFNALLDISRLDAGTIEAHPVHFPLKKMMQELEHQFRPLAEEKNLRLRFRPCAVTVYSDPLLIERILANLIVNAIRYTDDGGVLVGCRRRGHLLRISVIDSGRGIPPDQQEAVFQEFVQLHNPARDRSKGLGLGLAIVSRLGRLLGHRVNLRSRPDHGSVFSIDVPLGDASLVAPPVPPAPPVRLPKDLLVLLVDDESAILRGMAELFDHWGIDLVTAHSADEAEHWLASLDRVPDVIVSDYRLPEDSDGLAVIERLRQRFGHWIPAILITGDTAPETILRITRAGIPMLHKPLRPAKLRALLTHLVHEARPPAVG